jgi:DNA-binding MarR family transcriptional regulator
MSEWLDAAQRICADYRSLMLDIQRYCSSNRIPLNGEQALLLLGFGNEDRVTVKNVPYNGTNVSYNIKKLTDDGFLNYELCPDDRRQRYVSLTEKAKNVCLDILEHFEDRQEAA